MVVFRTYIDIRGMKNFPTNINNIVIIFTKDLPYWRETYAYADSPSKQLALEEIDTRKLSQQFCKIEPAVFIKKSDPSKLKTQQPSEFHAVLYLIFKNHHFNW